MLFSDTTFESNYAKEGGIIYLINNDAMENDLRLIRLNATSI